MKMRKNGCPICSGTCRVIGTTDHGKAVAVAVAVACANCTVYRISMQAVKLFLMHLDETRHLYSLLAQNSPKGHMMVVGTSPTELSYE